ncbi:MAG: carboxypeptidase regulatory-like domain-containing protein [Planctomycetota bacterium]
MKKSQKSSSRGLLLGVAGVVLLAVVGATAWLLGSSEVEAEDRPVEVSVAEPFDPEVPVFEGAAPPPRAEERIPVAAVNVRPAEPGKVVASLGQPTGCIEGRVVDLAGQPVAGAVLNVYLGSALITGAFPGSRQAVDARGESDAAGNFKLCSVPEGDHYIVVAEHDNFARSEAPPVRVRSTVSASGVVLVMQPGTVITGTVTGDNGGPLAGARLELFYPYDMAFQLPEEQKPWKVTFTDSAGRYAFTHVSLTSLRLRASADDHETQTHTRSPGFDVVARDEQVDFQLAYGSALQGRVIDADGVGLGSVRIEANAQTKSAQGHSLAISDASGYFLLDGIGDAKYQVRATKHGFSDVTRQNVHISAGSLQIVMEARGAVVGSVITRDGKPVESFSLHLMRSRPGSQPHSLNNSRELVAPDGRFVFDNLDPGDYLLEARADDLADARSEPFTIIRNDVSPEVQIVMSRGGSISGVVLTARGLPAAGAKVALNENNFQDNGLSQIFKAISPSDERERHVLTNKAGEFSFSRITPGIYQIATSHSESASQVLNDISIRDDDEGGNQPLRVTLSAGAVIAGRALDVPGGPLPFCKVQITSLQSNTPYMDAGTTDKDGFFSFNNLTSGSYTITVNPTTVGGQPVHPFVALVHAKKSAQEVYVGEGQVVDGLLLQLTDG